MYDCEHRPAPNEIYWRTVMVTYARTSGDSQIRKSHELPDDEPDLFTRSLQISDALSAISGMISDGWAYYMVPDPLK